MTGSRQVECAQCGKLVSVFGYWPGVCESCRLDRRRKELLDRRDWCDPYVSTQGRPYEYTKTAAGGYTTIEVLEFLKGLPLCNLVMSFVHGLRPTYVRVVRDEETCDARCGRVSIYIDENDRIRFIQQEVAVLGSCGAEVMRLLQELREAGR